MMSTPVGAAAAASSSPAAPCGKSAAHTTTKALAACDEETAAGAPERAHDRSRMCRYPSKKCWNPRALKRNGERHNLCDFHREKANKNQRRLESKRKAKASAAASRAPPSPPQTIKSATSGGKRARQQPTPNEPQKRTRKRRALLSAHVAMMEEARTKRLAAAVSPRVVATTPSTTSQFLHELVLLDGSYERSSFLAANAPVLMPTPTSASVASSKPQQKLQPKPMAEAEPTVQHVDLGNVDEALDRILLEGDVATLCKNLDANAELEGLPMGTTSPVDIGEDWGAFGMGEGWMAPVEELTEVASFDTSSYLVYDDVFAAEV